jgi:acyl-CoA thioester hydrolase
LYPIDYGDVQPSRVYYDELDAMGMLYHGRYAALLDRALLAYWSVRGYGTDLIHSTPDTFTVVRELTMTYHEPIRQHGNVTVHFWLNHVGRTSAEFGFRFLSTDGTTMHAEGRRTVIVLDPTSLRPTPWTEAGRAELIKRLRPAHDERDEA